jgi:hypothetical protein
MSAAQPAMFPRLLGEAYILLPAPVQRLHHNATERYVGEIEVERGEGWLSRCCGWAARLPPAYRGRFEVHIETAGEGERWARIVRGHAMRSRLWAQQGLLHERLGLLTFVFRLTADVAALRWQVVRVRVLGLLPLPPRWFVGVSAAETAAEGRYRFDVRAALPLAGLLVHYRGWLDVR